MKTYIRLFVIAGFVLFSSYALAARYQTFSRVYNVTSCHVQATSPGDRNSCPLYWQTPRGHIVPGHGASVETYNYYYSYNVPYETIPAGGKGWAPIMYGGPHANYWNSVIGFPDATTITLQEPTAAPRTFYAVLCNIMGPGSTPFLIGILLSHNPCS